MNCSSSQDKINFKFLFLVQPLIEFDLKLLLGLLILLIHPINLPQVA